MGLLGIVVEPLQDLLIHRSIGVIVVSVLASFIVLSIVLNVLNQLLFKNPKEPPVVFHWVPVVGSTITYGIDPYRFFFNCRQKVISSLPPCLDSRELKLI